MCTGFIEESKYNKMTEAEGQQMMGECFAYDDELRRGGHLLGGEAFQSANSAVTLRIKNGSVELCDGPYPETKDMLGGILLLEARDLNHATSLMSRHPGVKVGPFEIRPADKEIKKVIACRDAVIRKELISRASKENLRAALKFSYDRSGRFRRSHTDQATREPILWRAIVKGCRPIWSRMVPGIENRRRFSRGNTAVFHCNV